MTSLKDFTGRWRITSMELWDADAIDLVELAFISNPQEEARLRTRQYQRALAQGILEGLCQFLQTAVVAMH